MTCKQGSRIFILLLALSQFALAAEQETLFHQEGPTEHGVMVAVEQKFSQVDGHGRHFFGGKVAYILNHGFYIGGSGYGMSWGYDAHYPDSNGQAQYVHMGYGGLLLGYTFNSDKIFHLAVETVIGGGGYILSTSKFNPEDDWCDDDCNCDCDENANNGFFVFDPQIIGELNLAKHVRVSLGAGYRIHAYPKEKHGITGKEQSGPTVSFAVKFGQF